MPTRRPTQPSTVKIRPDFVRNPLWNLANFRKPVLHLRSYRPHSGGCRALILKYLTDFCWQTPDEILSVIEQIDDRVDGKLVHITLFNMKRRGEVARRLTVNFSRLSSRHPGAGEYILLKSARSHLTLGNSASNSSPLKEDVRNEIPTQFL